MPSMIKITPGGHLRGSPEKCMTVAEERHARVVLRKEETKRGGASDALFTFSKLPRMVKAI